MEHSRVHCNGHFYSNRKIIDIIYDRNKIRCTTEWRSHGEAGTGGRGSSPLLWLGLVIEFAPKLSTNFKGEVSGMIEMIWEELFDELVFLLIGNFFLFPR